MYELTIAGTDNVSTTIVHLRSKEPKDGEGSTRFSPVLIDMIKTECKCRRIDFSNYIRLAATAAMKHTKKSGTAEAPKEM